MTSNENTVARRYLSPVQSAVYVGAQNRSAWLFIIAECTEPFQEKV